MARRSQAQEAPEPTPERVNDDIPTNLGDFANEQYWKNFKAQDAERAQDSSIRERDLTTWEQVKAQDAQKAPDSPIEEQLDKATLPKPFEKVEPPAGVKEPMPPPASIDTNLSEQGEQEPTLDPNLLDPEPGPPQKNLHVEKAEDSPIADEAADAALRGIDPDSVLSSGYLGPTVPERATEPPGEPSPSGEPPVQPGGAPPGEDPNAAPEGQPQPGGDDESIPGLGVPYRDFIPSEPMVKDPTTGQWRNAEPGEIPEPHSGNPAAAGPNEEVASDETEERERSEQEQEPQPQTPEQEPGPQPQTPEQEPGPHRPSEPTFEPHDELEIRERLPEYLDLNVPPLVEEPAPSVPEPPGETETTSAGQGGTASASANGGSVTIGDVNPGGNAGTAIGVDAATPSGTTFNKIDKNLLDPAAPGPTLDPDLFDLTAPGPTIDPALLDPSAPGPNVDPNLLDPSAPGPNLDAALLDPAAPGPTLDPAQIERGEIAEPSLGIAEPAGVSEGSFTDPSLAQEPPPEPSTTPGQDHLDDAL